MFLEEQRSYEIIDDVEVCHARKEKSQSEPHCAFILGSIIEKSISVIEGTRIILIIININLIEKNINYISHSLH